jgi:hypothetical protein
MRKCIIRETQQICWHDPYAARDRAAGAPHLTVKRRMPVNPVSAPTDIPQIKLGFAGHIVY